MNINGFLSSCLAKQFIDFLKGAGHNLSHSGNKHTELVK
jgi:hypothetical protein